MPRDENGVYTPLRDWEADAANGTPFSPDRWNAQDADFAEALNDLPLKTVVPTVVPAGTLPTEVNPGSIMYEDGVVYIRIGQPVWVDVSSVGLTDADAIVAYVVEAVLDEGSALFHDTVLTGTPTAPTATTGTSTTQVATTAFVGATVDALVGGAPGALDTLEELAAALGDDANFGATVTNALAARLRVDANQSLSDGQKAQARANAGAVPGSESSVTLKEAGTDRAILDLDNNKDGRVRISPDGSTWHSALQIDRNTGALRAHNRLHISTNYTIRQNGATLDFVSVDGSSQWRFRNGESGTIRFVINQATLGVGVGVSAPVCALDVGGAIRPKSYTVATLPSAAAGVGQIIHVSDDPSGHVLAYSDGTNWRRVTDAATVGTARPREQLQANRTYYVRSDGNDSNTGLVNNAGGAFLTKQKAVDTISRLDLNGYVATVKVEPGTYTAGVILRPLVGGLAVLTGDSTPANCVISPASGSCITAIGVSGWSVSGFKTVSTGGAIQLAIQNSRIEITNMEYGDAAGSGIHLYGGMGAVLVTGNNDYTISAAAFGYHVFLDNNSVLYGGSRTVTLTGNPTFDTFVHVVNGANARFPLTPSGSVTAGKKYNAAMNGTIDSAGSTYPGPTSGTTQTGGQFA